jgi:hypothetical protein
MLVVDDMRPHQSGAGSNGARQNEVRRTLPTSPPLTSIELSHGSGVIFSSRRA